MNDGGRMNPGNTTPCPTGHRKSQELDIFLLHDLNGGKLLCTLLWSPMVLRVLTFQHAILVFDLACKNSTWF